MHVRSIACTSFAFYIRRKSAGAIPARRHSDGWETACQSGRDAGLAEAIGNRLRVSTSSWRDENGSSQKARTKERSEEERWPQNEGPAQCLGTQGCPHAREKSRRQEGRTEIQPQTQIARFIAPTKKPATSSAFLFGGVRHREYRALASSTIRETSAGYSSPDFCAARANSLFCSR